MYTLFTNMPCQPVQNRYTMIQPNTPCNANVIYKPVKANTCSYLSYGKMRKATYEPYTLLGDIVDEVPTEPVQPKAGSKLPCNCGV